MSTRPERTAADSAVAAGRPLVGYLGPAGTFTEQALLASAAPDSVEPVALASIYETVIALRDGASIFDDDASPEGELSWALVPIENSLDGSISVTLDLLVGEASDVKIVGEALLRVHHCLIAAERVPLAEIDTVITHPQVPGQCTRLLHGALAHASVLPASSTAEAVRSVVSEGRRGHAALGTALAASIYGGTIISENVEDRADNETRFVWLARPSGESAHGPKYEQPPLRTLGTEWKTSLAFWGTGAARPGWLVHCLDEFARREINLTKIESRPSRQGMGDYVFFIDLAGRAQDQPVAQALAGLTASCERVLVLGSYPAAQASAAQA